MSVKGSSSLASRALPTLPLDFLQMVKKSICCKNIQFANGHWWSNPLKGEARAARLARSLALEFDGRAIVLEGDAQIVVTQVLEDDREPDWLIAGEVQSIRALLKTHRLWNLQWTSRGRGVWNKMAHKLGRWGFQFVQRVDLIADEIPLEIVSCDDSAVFSRVSG